VLNHSTAIFHHRCLLPRYLYSSQCSMLLHVPSPACDARTTSLTHSPERLPRACSVQAGDGGVPVTERHGTILSNCRPPSRRRLHSSLTHQLDVRQSQCATVGDRAFATAGARLWNSLPTDTLSQFHRKLETVLFRQSYPSILLYFFFMDLVVFI